MTSEGRVQESLVRAAPYLALAVVVAVFLRGWWNGDLPGSPRLELTPELGHIWSWIWRFRQGEGLSAWNHLVLTGQPVLTSRAWYFYGGLAFLSLGTGLSPEWLLKVTHPLMMILAGWGMMAFARQLGVSRAGALVAGVVYALFPTRVFVTVEALCQVAGWAGLPWMFWGYERLLASRKRAQGVRWGLVLGLVLAWVALHSPQMFMLGGAALAVYAGARALTGIAWETPMPRTVLLGGAVAVALAVGLCLYSYLPAARESHLLGLRLYLGVRPKEALLPAPLPLLAWALGARFGPDFRPLDHGRYIMYADFTFYLGWSVLALAAVGLAAGRRTASAWCLAATGAFAFLLAVGPTVPYNPVYWLVRRLPVLDDLVRVSLRALIGLSVVLAPLAGMGAEGLAARLRQPIFRGGVASALALLVALDFWPGSQAYSSVGEYLRPDEVAVHQWLDAQSGHDRFWIPLQVEPYGWHYVRSTSGWPYNRRVVLSEESFQVATMPWHALRVVRSALLLEVEGQEGGIPPLAQTILSLVGARWGLVHRNAPVYDDVVARLVAHRGWRVLRQTEHVYLLENPGARPYLQAYRQGALVQGGEEGFPLEWLPGCLERGYALVEGAAGEGPWAAAGEGGCASLPSVGEAEVHLEGGPPVRDVIRVRVQGDEGFVLMVAESWYPHWHVEVDGREVPLLRVNGGFLGVAVPAGEHGVRFAYRVPAYQ
ncbi:MAG: YfhO family protein, partial [Anaerolineae bacterium]